jgi:transcriptional regulator with XRE-family HTH domain
LNQADRIKELRKKIGLTQEEFAQKIGIKNTAISKIENGDATLTDQNILLICTPSRLVPSKTISETWLRTGKGEMFASITGENARETELLGIYRQLWDENKTAVSKHAKFLLREQKDETKASRREDTTKKTV